MGSTRLLTDGAGAVTDRYAFEAFGELIDHVGSDPNDVLFAGEPRSAATGLYYLRARWMDPVSGRFVNRDPFVGEIFDPQSLHAYTYAHLDPVGKSDPTGFYTGIVGVLTVGLGLMFAFPAGASPGAGRTEEGEPWTAANVQKYRGFVDGLAHNAQVHSKKIDCADLAIHVVIRFASI